MVLGRESSEHLGGAGLEVLWETEDAGLGDPYGSQLAGVGAATVVEEIAGGAQNITFA